MIFVLYKHMKSSKCVFVFIHLASLHGYCCKNKWKTWPCWRKLVWYHLAFEIRKGERIGWYASRANGLAEQLSCEKSRESHIGKETLRPADWRACSTLLACDRAAVRLFERYHSAKKNLSVFILSFFNLHTVWLFKTAKDKWLWIYRTASETLQCFHPNPVVLD